MTPFFVGATLLVYIAVLLGVAGVSSQGARNTDFFLAGRTIRWPSATMVMIASAMSGITFISVTGSVAADAFSYMQMTIGFAIGQGVIALVLIPLLYRMRITSLYEYLDHRFGRTTHHSGAWIFLLAKSVIVALRIYVMCIVMQTLVFDQYGVPLAANVIFIVFVVWLATIRGGMTSLVWTESLKTICLVASLVLCIIYISASFGWGVRDSISEVFASQYSRIFFFDDTTSPYYFWKMFWAGTLSIIAMTGLDHDMMQCNLSCVNMRHAQVNIMLTALCQTFVILLFLVLGALLYIYAERNGMALPDKSDQLFALVAVNGGLPRFVGVLFVLGLTSSTLTSAASSLTALTTSASVDLLGGQRQHSEERLTRLRHRVHTALAVAVAILILIVGGVGSQSVINTLFKFVGYAYGPILGIFAFGILTRYEIHDRAVPVVAVMSLLLTIFSQWVLLRAFDYQTGFEILIYNATFTIVGMFLIRKR